MDARHPGLCDADSSEVDGVEGGSVGAKASNRQYRTIRQWNDRPSLENVDGAALPLEQQEVPKPLRVTS